MFPYVEDLTQQHKMTKKLVYLSLEKNTLTE